MNTFTYVSKQQHPVYTNTTQYHSCIFENKHYDSILIGPNHHVTLIREDSEFIEQHSFHEELEPICN